MGLVASAGFLDASRFVFETSPPVSAPGCGEVWGGGSYRLYLSVREVRAPRSFFIYLFVREVRLYLSVRDVTYM